VNTSLVGPFASAFIVSYTIGAHLEGRALAVGVGWLVVLVTALSLLDPNADEGLNLVWGWLVIVAAPVLAGRLLRNRARLARELRAAASDEDPEPWAEQAVAEERTRIAAELHDVVARALRRMVLDADGAARLVDADPPGRRWPSPPSSRPGAMRWPRSGACSASCAARTTSWRSPRSRRWPTSPTSSAARAPPACRWRCTSMAP
jgi:Histidine kinase